MDAYERHQLQDRTVAEVRRMLEEGDLHYLRGLDRAGLLGALEDELRFLGLYARDDQDSPAVIHALVDAHLDEWCAWYLRPRGQGTRVSMDTPPWVVSWTASVPSERGDCTHYYDFRPRQAKR